MRRITMIFAACLAVAFSGAAVAIASSGKGGGGGSTTNERTTSTGTTGTTTTPGRGALRRSRQVLGRVTAIDAAAKKFDLRVIKRRGSIRRGAVLTILTTNTTRYKGLTGFDAIAVGNIYKVKIGRTADGNLVAKTVEQKRPHPRGGANNGRDDDDPGKGRREGNDDKPTHDAQDDQGGDSGNSGPGRGGRDD